MEHVIGHSLPVEVIVWEDSDIQFREKLMDEPLINVTQGWLVRETPKLVVLMHEATHDDNFMRDQMDYTRILKRNILLRYKGGEMPVVFNLKRGGGKRGKAKEKPKAEVLADAANQERVTESNRAEHQDGGGTRQAS